MSFIEGVIYKRKTIPKLPLPKKFFCNYGLRFAVVTELAMPTAVKPAAGVAVAALKRRRRHLGRLGFFNPALAHTEQTTADSRLLVDC